MILVLPTRVRSNRDGGTLPLANLAIIAANVLLYPFCDNWYVGPGTGLFSIVTYAFAHVSWWHLLINMAVLFVVGNPVNRRLGNRYYLAAYFGTVIVLGIVGKLLISTFMLGSSGAIFAMIAICLLLMPGAWVDFYYIAVAPTTFLIGLFSPPREPIYWILRGDHFQCRAIWLLFVVPLLEIWGLFWVGWNWGHLAHLMGMATGLAVVLLLPKKISLGRQYASEGLF